MDSAKRGLESQLQAVDDKKSPGHKKAKKEKKEKKEKKSKHEKRQEESEHWKSQASNTPYRPQPLADNVTKNSPARKETVRAHSEARSVTSRSSTVTTKQTGEDRLRLAEQDINDLWSDNNILFSGMKQIQKQQAYLMQRDAILARKEANTQAVMANWPPHAQEHDRDRIVDWLVGRANIPSREFLHASHKIQEDSLSRIAILHFRSAWATKKFLETCRKIASGKNPLSYGDSNNTIPQDTNGRPYYLQFRQQICTIDRIRSIPMKAFLQVIHDTPRCMYHNQTRDLYKNWGAHAIYNEEGNLLKCIFYDAEGTVKIFIRENFFSMVEDGISTAWRKIVSRPADEEFQNHKGKGGKKGSASSSRPDKGIDDYLYTVYLVKVRPSHDEEDNP